MTQGLSDPHENGDAGPEADPAAEDTAVEDTATDDVATGADSGEATDAPVRSRREARAERKAAKKARRAEAHDAKIERRVQAELDGTSRRLSPLAIALVACCVVALVAATVMTVLWLHERGQADRLRTDQASALELRQAYVSKANDVMTDIMTIKPDTIADDVKKINGEIEGDFQQQFSPRTDSYQQLIQQTQIIANGSIIASGVEKTYPDHADVLMAINQAISNPQTPQAQQRTYRMRITVNRHADGTMKVSGVNFVP